MKKRYFLILTPLLSVNTLAVLLNACGHHSSSTMCAYYYQASLTGMNNADSIPHLPDAGGVPARAFYLALALRDTQYTCRAPQPVLTCSALYAEQFNDIKQTPVDSITITSNRDFDPAHPAGSDLKSLFNINDTSKLSYLHGGTNNFYLLHDPADTGTYTFTINLFAGGGTKNLTATSLPVKLLL